MPKKILLVEDEKTTIHLIHKFIGDMGYSLSKTVSTGEEAIQEVAHMNPDLVIMDIVLGGDLDGIEAARHINEIYRTPVIYITSSSDTPTLKRALDTDPSGYIVKPIDKKELKSAVEMAFLRHEMEDKLKENELRFFTILNSIGEAVVVFDESDRISYVNPEAERLMELTIDKIVGKRFDEIIQLRYYGIDAGNGGETSGISYYYFLSKNGNKVPVNFSISPIKDISGAKIGSVIILRNDSDRVDFELKLNDSYHKVKNAIKSIVLAMAQTLEMRDPYTAGHQRRVADIARTIAKEMNLPGDEVEGVFMASLIHDLGKISIPSEILSKPSRLSSLEFDLMKMHPQIGYDILKSMNFPWPLADLVHQHHERCNGSGYPLGLKGDNILFGARILSVADVVEAMASDRPYRPALGIDKALEEISSNKGKLYDIDVANACEKIFTHNNYQLT
jgi:PAS domain S-box-containing protein